MPYIDQTARIRLQQPLESPKTPGELNYLITELCKQYIKVAPDSNLSYQTINDVLGALEGCKLEFYRRIAVSYENTKISLNGDVY